MIAYFKLKLVACGLTGSTNTWLYVAGYMKYNWRTNGVLKNVGYFDALMILLGDATRNG